MVTQPLNFPGAPQVRVDFFIQRLLRLPAAFNGSVQEIGQALKAFQRCNRLKSLQIAASVAQPPRLTSQKPIQAKRKAGRTEAELRELQAKGIALDWTVDLLLL